jgi:hypothetical protein
MDTALEQLTRNKLLRLADLPYWKKNFKMNGKMSWDYAVSELIAYTGNYDFNPDKIRGRGAWREGDKICFNTGSDLLGEFNDKKLYIKKYPIDIGLNETPASQELCMKIADIIRNLSFSTRIDSMRFMGWVALAPFSGALPWRPAILLTGPSSSGKTTIADFIGKKISNSEWFNGSETTPAFLRQKIQNDSCGIIMNECDKDLKKKRENVEAIFSVVRQSTSDNAPISGKGSASGKAISYNMKNMFMMVSISPEIEHIADENRIFRVNLKKPKNKWSSIRSEIKKYITNKNCRAIRSLTWTRLKDIINFASEFTDTVQDITKKDTRQSYAEALLFSAYLYIWYGYEKLTIDIAKPIFAEYYEVAEVQQLIDEPEEILDKILDSVVMLVDSKNKKTLREMLISVYNGADESHENKRTLGHYGLSLVNNNTELAIYGGKK